MARSPAADVERALAILNQASSRPRAAVEQGRALVASRSLAPEARAIGWRGLAYALRVLDRFDEATDAARRAVKIASGHQLRVREGEARLTLALCLFQRGRTSAAVTELDRARALAGEELGGRADVQHGIILERLGRFDDAVDAYGRALAVTSDDLDRARALNNRGIAFTFLGRFDDACADLNAAIHLAERSDARMLVAEFIHNLGFALATAGELPAALRRFDEADEIYLGLGVRIGLTLVTRARALLAANLHREAREAAAAAVAEMERSGGLGETAEARILLADAELRDGDVDAALRTADRARRSLDRQGRRALSALAVLVMVRARVANGQRDRRTLAMAERCASALQAAGLIGEELEARLTAGIVARDLGDARAASAQLGPVRQHRDRGRLVERARAWHAEALCRLDEAVRAGARRAASAGLERIVEVQQLMGATELRVSMAGHGSLLDELGLRLAVEDGDAHGVLGWVDAWRAASLGFGGTDSPDPKAAAELAALRAAVAQSRDVAGNDDDPAMAARRIAELERGIRARTRHAGGSTATHRAEDHDIARSLGDRTAILYIELDGRIGAVVVEKGRARLHPTLGIDRAACDELAVSTLFALRRLARPRGALAGVSAARASLADALIRLDEALVAPLIEAEERPIVVCPTGALHAVPWSALPSCRALPVTVVPSLAALQEAPPVGGHVVLVAGPGLPGALAEVDDLLAVHPRATWFGPHRSHVDAVLAALEGSSLAHLACHGSFRADNPMFSALEMADGPLTVYDIEKLDRPPTTVVLAACDVGTSAVHAGDELLGITAGLLRAGSRSVLASLVPVPDHASIGFMLALHRALRDGASPAKALVEARLGLGDDPAGLALQAAFNCYGAG